jgi:hypothetical protein
LPIKNGWCYWNSDYCDNDFSSSHYWSSSLSDSIFAKKVSIDIYNRWGMNHDYKANASAIRCFKDSPKAPETLTLTFNQNG